MLVSETGCEEGKDMAVRGLIGLKRPGDEMGVLLAVCVGGGCKVLSLDGEIVTFGSEGAVGFMVDVATWVWDRTSLVKRDVLAAERHHGLGDEAGVKPEDPW